MVVVRRRSGKAVLGAEIMMLGRVGVSRQADRMRAAREQFQERGAIDGVHDGIGWVEIGLQRNVHAGHDQFVGRKLLERVGDEG